MSDVRLNHPIRASVVNTSATVASFAVSAPSSAVAGQGFGVADGVADELRDHGDGVGEQLGGGEGTQFAGETVAGEAGSAGVMGHDDTPGALGDCSPRHSRLPGA